MGKRWHGFLGGEETVLERTRVGVRRVIPLDLQRTALLLEEVEVPFNELVFQIGMSSLQ